MVGCRPEDYKDLTDEELWSVFKQQLTACEEQALMMEMNRRGLFGGKEKKDG